MGAVSKIDTSRISEKAENLRRTFAKRIVNQEEAVTAFTNVLEKFLSSIYDRTKPIASLLFLGPTGTGKTSSVEAFAEGLFGVPNMMIKIDCAEFQHSHEIAKLIGSPPGYLGHRETTGIITNEKLKNLRSVEIPFSVILFDEIEKASDSLWNLLLGILDKGVLTLGTNEVVNMASTVIVMTSNIGSKEMAAAVGDGVTGFQTPAQDDVQQDDLRHTAVDAAKRKFMPEFMNRIDEVVMFNTLTKEDSKKIMHLEVQKLKNRILLNGTTVLDIAISPGAEKAILEKGFDKKYNARFLQRTVEELVTLPIARAITTGQARDHDMVIIDYDKGEFLYLV